MNQKSCRHNRLFRDGLLQRLPQLIQRRDQARLQDVGRLAALRAASSERMFAFD